MSFLSLSEVLAKMKELDVDLVKYAASCSLVHQVLDVSTIFRAGKRQMQCLQIEDYGDAVLDRNLRRALKTLEDRLPLTEAFKSKLSRSLLQKVVHCFKTHRPPQPQKKKNQQQNQQNKKQRQQQKEDEDEDEEEEEEEQEQEQEEGMYLEDEQEPRAAVSRRSGRKKKSARQTTDFIYEHANGQRKRACLHRLQTQNQTQMIFFERTQMKGQREI